MISDPIECFAAQIQRCESDIGTPHGVVVSAFYVWRERILAGMSSRAMAAVVPEGDRLGEGDVESDRPRDGHRNLCHLESMGKSRSLMIFGKHEDLGLACQPAERRSMQNAVAVTLEAGAERVGLLLDGAVSRTERTRGERRKQGCFARFPLIP